VDVHELVKLIVEMMQDMEMVPEEKEIDGSIRILMENINIHLHDYKVLQVQANDVIKRADLYYFVDSKERILCKNCGSYIVSTEQAQEWLDDGDQEASIIERNELHFIYPQIEMVGRAGFEPAKP
jgi:hypothetical protein